MRKHKKEKIQKKIMGILLAIMMIFNLLPIDGFYISIFAAEETVTVTVAGVNLVDGYYKIDENNSIVESTESEYNIHFNQSTNTLTLRDAVIPEGGNAGIQFNYVTNDDEATIELIGENRIIGKTYVIRAEKTGSLPSTSADVDVILTICGSGGLNGEAVWGIQATNLIIDESTIDITTGGHSAFRIHRDCIIRNAKIITRDTGDGGDFYVDRSLQIINSTVDISDIQVEYPSIYVANTYCPEELLIKPALIIKESNLMIGGLADSSLGYSIYVTKGGAEISDLTFTAVNKRKGIYINNGTLKVDGISTIDTGNNIAIRTKESAKIGENVKVTGNSVAGTPFINDGLVCLPESVTEEQLENLHYYGGGTIKIGDNKIYHSVRFDLEDNTQRDEIETQWILDGSIISNFPEEEMTKDGFDFLGWAEEDSEVWDFENDQVTKSLLFQPKWQHIHSWLYMLDGLSTIKAVCSANGCENPEQSITIAVPEGDLIYDGLEKAAVLDGTIDGIEPEIIYNTEGNSIPVNAGNYTASITVGEKTASVAYEIARAVPDIGTVTGNTINDSLDISDVVLSRTDKTIDGTLELTDSVLKYGTHTYTWEFIPGGDCLKTINESLADHGCSRSHSE